MSTQLLRIQLHTLDGCDMFTSSAQFRGLLLISAVVLIWVLASFLVQNIEQSGEAAHRASHAQNAPPPFHTHPALAVWGYYLCMRSQPLSHDDARLLV